ncbi:MAG: PIN domain-containing protein [Nanoarchaeota archaeon]|nr:PIN domain-containing protein [Nanoarchaeota archaeon]
MEKSETIFADSNYFIALFYPKDAQHEKARKIARALDAGECPLVISSFVFLEAVTVASQRGGKEVGILVGESLMNNPKVRIIHVDLVLQEKSWRVFQEIKQKDVSFVDASIIAVMKDEGIRKLLTFDTKHFAPLAKRYRLSLL